MKRELFKDIIKYAPSQAIPAIVGLVAIPIVTRLFQPSDYGKYVLVMATISALSIFCGWIGMSVIRFYPICEREERMNELTASVGTWFLITVAVLSTLYIIVILLTRGQIDYQLYKLMLVGVAVFALTAIFEALQNFLRARRWVGWYSGFAVWRSVGSLGIGITLVVMLRYGIEGLLWGFVLSMVLALPLLLKLSVGQFSMRSSLSSALAKEMARYSFPLVIGNLAAWVLSLSDRYILEFFRGAQEVGIYSVNYAIAEKTIVLLTTLFWLASRPIGIYVWEKDGEERARDFVSSVTRYYLLLCVPAVVGLSVLAQLVMVILAGATYHEGFRVMPLIALGCMLLGLQQKFQMGFIFHRKTWNIAIAIIAGGLTNVVLNLLLVPRYGYMAAAVTTLIGYAVLLTVMVVTSRKFFVWDFPFKSLGRATLASIIMAAAIYPLSNSLTASPLVKLIVAVPLGLALYLALILLLGEVQPNEKRVIRSVLIQLFRYTRHPLSRRE